MISPPEGVHAFLLAVARGCRESNVTALKDWRKLMLCTCAFFQEAENELYWATMNLREKPGLEHDLVRHSALQRVLEVWNLAQDHDVQKKRNKPKP